VSLGGNRTNKIDYRISHSEWPSHFFYFVYSTISFVDPCGGSHLTYMPQVGIIFIPLFFYTLKKKKEYAHKDIL